jgi:two-component system, cell cycle response regulator CtrA
MRLLIVEDDASTSGAMDLMLRSEGFNPYVTDLGEEAVSLAKLYDYDAITLDLNLPDIHGIEVLRQVRAAGLKTPIIIVSGMDGALAKARALNMGADDYLTKPFHKDELVARLRALIRRSAMQPNPIITVGEIAIDTVRQEVRVGGQIVHFTGKEYQVLELLALRMGQVVTKDAILNHLYGGMDEPELKIVDVFVCKIRNKLRWANGGAHHIETAWGRGYALQNDPDTPAAFDPRDFNSMRRHVLDRLTVKPSTTHEILSGSPHKRGSLISTISHCVLDGLAVNRGTKRAAIYTITAAGRVWLADRSAVAA